MNTLPFFPSADRVPSGSSGTSAEYNPSGTFVHRSITFVLKETPDPTVICRNNHLVTEVLKCNRGHLLCRTCQFPSSVHSGATTTKTRQRCPVDNEVVYNDEVSTKAFVLRQMECPSTVTFNIPHRKACSEPLLYCQLESHLDNCLFIPSAYKIIIQDSKIEELRRENACYGQRLDEAEQLLTNFDSVIDMLLKTPITYDGNFTWAIDNYQLKLSKAVAGESTYFYSEPFFSHKNGYRLALRLYPNGYGVGEGTHASVFLSILKGNHDALLNWPFSHKVTLTALDQSVENQNNLSKIWQNKDAVYSLSLQRPMRSYVSKGLCFEEFLPHAERERYVKNDTLFINVSMQESSEESSPELDKQRITGYCNIL